MLSWYNAIVADAIHDDTRDLLIDARAGMLEKRTTS